MKKLTLSFCAIVALASGAFAGPTEVRSSGKEVQQAAVQSDCFADREWNIDLWGNYAFTGNSYQEDQYLRADHAFGGGVDVNYFFMRYLGAGLEGYAMGAHGDVFGQVSGNLIFRYPVPGTCFAPYAYAGGGVLFNGGDTAQAIRRGNNLNENRTDAEALAQGGLGVEYRFTQRVGIMNDFSWNVVNGGNNNYGMVRAGIRFAF